MHEHFVSAAHQIVKFSGTLKKFVKKVFVIKVLNWKMDSCHTTGFVVLLHQIPVIPTVFNISVCLHIENSCDSLFVQLLGITLNLWIVSNIDSCFRDLVEREASNKVGIMLLYMAIYDMDLVDISPELTSLLTKMTIV